MPIRVLIADDQTLMRAGLRMILAADPDIEVVGEAADGPQALDEAERLRPDIALLDVRMPGLDGVAVARRLAAMEPPVTVVVLTTFDLDEYAHRAIDAGARGFLLKSQPPAEITAAIKAVAAGQAVLAPPTTSRMLAAYRRRGTLGPQEEPSHSPADVGEAPVLTERERSVLARLALGESTAVIAQRLTVSQATVNTHVQHILRKLGANSRLQAVAVAYTLGLIAPVGRNPLTESDESTDRENHQSRGRG
jgi:DNA-binding NarL/FixJ family response regulator